MSFCVIVCKNKFDFADCIIEVWHTDNDQYFLANCAYTEIPLYLIIRDDFEKKHNYIDDITATMTYILLL